MSFPHASRRLVVWLDAQRAWYAPLSIESDPKALPALELALQPVQPPHVPPTA